MAKISIKTSEGKIIETQGRMTFQLDRLEDDSILCTGHLAMHEYIEDIDEIETCRYKLSGVEVYREIFGSNDFNILYEFKLDEVEGDFEIKEETLTEEQIEAIKKEEYIDEDSNKWE